MAGPRVQAVGQLVQEDQFGVIDQGKDDEEMLFLAAVRLA
jgi:hypothetical protein